MDDNKFIEFYDGLHTLETKYNDPLIDQLKLKLVELVNHNTLLTIAKANRFDIIQWLFSNTTDENKEKTFVQYEPYYISKPNNYIFIFCIKGNFDAIKWFCVKLKDYMRKPTFSQYLTSLFIYACEYNHITMAKWLYNYDVQIHNKNIIYNNIFNGYDHPFMLACNKCSIDVAKWLYYDIGNINIHRQDDLAFRNACKNGNLSLAQWLYSLGSDIKSNIDNLFHDVCCKNHIEIARWLYEISQIDMSILPLLFNSLCTDGALDTAKFILNIIKEKNIQVNINDAFYKTCTHGHLIIAQWLYDIYPNEIDIQYNDNGAIVNSIYYVDVVKWLYSKGANIHARNNYIFNYMMVLQNNIEARKKPYYIELGAFLCKVCEDFVYENDRYRIITIKDKIKANKDKYYLDAKILDQSNDDPLNCSMCLQNSEDNDLKYWIKKNCGHITCLDCYVDTDICSFGCKDQNPQKIDLLKFL